MPFRSKLITSKSVILFVRSCPCGQLFTNNQLLRNKIIFGKKILENICFIQKIVVTLHPQMGNIICIMNL